MMTDVDMFGIMDMSSSTGDGHSTHSLLASCVRSCEMTLESVVERDDMECKEIMQLK